VTPFAEEYAKGRTPNPCIVCNDVVKFGDLLKRVRLQGADALATGHYARIVADGARKALARGVDPGKDQSYFLYRMTEEQLDAVVFPVGELHKSEVRSIAQRIGLSVAEKPDSQETCFAADGEYGPVVGQRAPDALRAGEIVDRDGTVVGRHHGLARYTVGQRKGLGMGGGGPWFVIGLDAETNRIVVGSREDLAVSEVVASDIVWHGGSREDVTAMTRYRMAAVPGTAVVADGELTVELDVPVEAVAPGQSLVCYRGDIVLGGGVIRCAS
jgi:tRNA-specific 2-thiouridylase